MFQQYRPYCVDLPPGGFRVTSQSVRAEQTNATMPEKNHADVMHTGIIVHDATQNALMNAEVIHEVDLQQDSEVDSQGDGGAERNTQLNQPDGLSWFGDLWCWLVDRFSFSSELQVRQQHDRAGNLWWHMYDPITKRSAQCSSESEARVWIEQSYHRQFK